MRVSSVTAEGLGQNNHSPLADFHSLSETRDRLIRDTIFIRLGEAKPLAHDPQLVEFGPEQRDRAQFRLCRSADSQ
jgi:hypothetical protein